MFISLDGADGTGKSTQLGLLAAWLGDLGHDVLTCRDPGSTPLGESVRGLVLDPQGPAICRRAEMLLYMAARAQLVEQIIRPGLAASKLVISDRYLLANVVYQGHAGGLDPESLWQIGEVATGGLRPTLTIVLDLDPHLAHARIGRETDRMERQGLEFRLRLRSGFLEEARKQRWPIAVIDALGSAEEVHDRIRAAVGSIVQ